MLRANPGCHDDKSNKPSESFWYRNARGDHDQTHRRWRGKFQSADEMVLSVVKPDLEYRVAACSILMEAKTKLIVQVVIGIIAFIVMLAIGIDPYFIVIPIALVEIGSMVYVGVMGGTDALILQKNVATGSNWGGVFVIKGVSYDEHNRVFSYDSVHELNRSRIQKKSNLSPFGGLKFKHEDTTFTVISTMSKKKQNIYREGMATLKEVKGLLFR